MANRWRTACCTPAFGIEHNLAGRVIDEPDGQRDGEFASPGFGELAAAQAGPDEVQLGLAHGALEPEEEPVVELAGVVEAVLVADQRVGERADLQQPVPIGVVACQA